MVSKLVNAAELRKGSAIMIDDAPCIVQRIDISKTGKHGHAKARIEAVGIVDNKKRILVKPGHEKFGVPQIEKKKGQVLSVLEDKASIMDIESYETLEAKIMDEVKGEVKEGSQVEYWVIEGQLIVKRII
jgi:translation initiation factor 5A